MIELTATSTSALSSMTAGVFPAPTPSAGFPLEYAAFTIPGPPVASIRSAPRMTAFVSSSDGTSIHAMIPSGAPAATAASRIVFAARIVEFFARGCGLMIIPLRVLSASSVLKIAVEVGFVVGMTAAITPTGSAIFCVPNSLSSSMTPQVFTFL